MQKHRVRALLMGGRACVLYGTAEFSRDTDFALLASQDNIARLRNVLSELRTPELLDVVHEHPKQAGLTERTRPPLKAARCGQFGELVHAFAEKEQRERERDRQYWAPLKMEFEAMRRKRIKP